MRRITVIGMIILGLVALPLVAAAKPSPDKKTEICHFTSDVEAHVIEVSNNAFEAHEAHGDWAVNADNPAEACGAPSDTTELPALTADFTYIIVSETCFLTCLVELDATASEGAIDTYVWSAPNIDNSTGMITTMYLPNFAITTVTLSVISPDGDARTSMDIDVFVLPPTTP